METGNKLKVHLCGVFGVKAKEEGDKHLMQGFHGHLKSVRKAKMKCKALKRVQISPIGINQPLQIQSDTSCERMQGCQIVLIIFLQKKPFSDTFR